MMGGSVGSILGAGTQGTPTGNGSVGNTDPQAEVRKSELQAERTAQQNVVSGCKEQVDTLLKQLAAAATDIQKEQLNKSLDAARTQLSEAQSKLGSVEDQLGSLMRNVNAVAGEIGAEQKQQAKTLRDLEHEMLQNVEKYENARREQAAELIAITVLLDGKRDTQQTIELAVRSLNVSVAALKRSKQIVEEIAFFFKSFADFMQVIIDEATLRVEDYENAAAKETLRKNYLAQLVKNTDRFFVTQTAEWMAVSVVADKFVQVFNGGWSRLNKLSGTYIMGAELEAYLEQASNQLKMIVHEREATASQRVASLKNYREEVKKQA
jgi:hypothetical protein